MAPRPYWKGYLKLSLASCPIALSPATSSSEKISFRQVNKETGNRIRYKKLDSETEEEVSNDQIGKGYEIGKNEYLIMDDEELEAVELERTHTIDIDRFVPFAKGGLVDVEEFHGAAEHLVAPCGCRRVNRPSGPGSRSGIK
jgi:DNA end-binding protein Ku